MQWIFLFALSDLFPVGDVHQKVRTEASALHCNIHGSGLVADMVTHCAQRAPIDQCWKKLVRQILHSVSRMPDN